MQEGHAPLNASGLLPYSEASLMSEECDTGGFRWRPYRLRRPIPPTMVTK